MNLVNEPQREGGLTPSQLHAFERSRKRVIIAFGWTGLLGLLLFIADSHVDLNDYMWWILALIFPSVINAIWASWRYKCPRCGRTPSTKRLSFGDDVQYSGAVAFFPKACSECGVSFRRPEEEQPGGPR